MKRKITVFESHASPYLEIDAIEYDSKKIILRKGGRELGLDVHGDAAKGLKVLENLRNPKSAAWNRTKLTNDIRLSETVEALNTYGWISDAGLEGKKAFDKASKAIVQLEHEALKWMFRAASDLSEATQEFHALAQTISKDAFRLLDELENKKRSADLKRKTAPYGGSDTVQAEALFYYLRLLQRTSPAALWTFCRVLRKFEAAALAKAHGKDVPPYSLTGIEEPASVVNQVWTCCCLLVQAVNKKNTSRHRNYMLPEQAGSGINTIVVAEGLAEQLLSDAGERELLRVISDGRYTKACAKGIFLHQHFITLRYLESIYSFLRFRKKNELQRTGLEYLLEEVGHDVHEKEACLKLGLREEDLDRFSPLPLFEAYTELLAYFAEINPVSFCLSVLIAEGMPGQKKIIVDALAENGIEDPDLATHTELDLNLNHSYYPRKLAQSVGWIDSASRQEALATFLFILELSQMGWEQIATFSKSKKADFPQAFKVSPAAVYKL